MGEAVKCGIRCPVCNDDDMYEELETSLADVLYWCSACGYRNEFRILDDKSGSKYIKWDGRIKKRKFLKWVEVKPRHGLIFSGKRIPFYPADKECDDVLVRRKERKGKLVWRVYSLAWRKRFLGEFGSFGEAQEFGFKYVDDPIELTKLPIEELGETIAASNVEKRTYIAWAFGLRKHAPAVVILVDLLTDKSSRVREAAAWALGQITERNYGNNCLKWQRWWRRNRKTFKSEEYPVYGFPIACEQSKVQSTF